MVPVPSSTTVPLFSCWCLCLLCVRVADAQESDQETGPKSLVQKVCDKMETSLGGPGI